MEVTLSRKLRQRTIMLLALCTLASLCFSMPTFSAESVPITMLIASQPVKVAEWLDVFETEFNEANPDIKLEIELLPSVAALRDRVITTTAAGIGPDLFYEASNNVSRWIMSDMARPIDDFFNAKADKDDFLPDVMRLAQFRGETYGFPFVSWPIYTLYNLDFFVEAGIHEPQNWDDMIKAARKLTRHEADRISVFGWRTNGNNAVLAFGDLQLSLEQLGSTTIPEDGLKGSPKYAGSSKGYAVSTGAAPGRHARICWWQQYGSSSEWTSGYTALGLNFSRFCKDGYLSRWFRIRVWA